MTIINCAGRLLSNCTDVQPHKTNNKTHKLNTEVVPGQCMNQSGNNSGIVLHTHRKIMQFIQESVLIIS